MQATLDMPRAATATPERIFVKWKTPEEELLACAKLAFALVDRRIARPAQVAIAAPNRNWAAQAYAAAQHVATGLPELHVATSLCVAPLQVSPQATAALHSLEELPQDNTLRGRSLAHHVGLDALPEFEHALLHLQGSEDAPALLALMRAQLTHASVPEHTLAVPIMLTSALEPNIDYLFMVGCVEGLVGSREVFWNAVQAGRVRTTISCFTQVPVALASAAGIAYARCKTQESTRWALAQPTKYLSEAGHIRPTTEGGQALLRKYRLN